MTSVLVIDDNDDFRGMLARTLADAGYAVTEESGGRSGLIAARTTDPDVVLLDLSMPDMDGWQVLDGIRRDSPLPAVIVLSAYQREADAVQALGRGADDYVTKPFSRGDLLARVGTAARRGETLAAMEGSSALEWGPLAIDLERRTVTRDGTVVDLTKSEFDLLAALLAAPHQVLSRRTLLNRTRGPEWSGDEHSVDIHMSRLRRKLGDGNGATGIIETVRGVGFRLALPRARTASAPTQKDEPK